MKRIFYILAILTLFTLPSYGEATLSGSGDFSGRAVLSFLGTSVTAPFTGKIFLSGTLTNCGETIPFTASGTIDGTAAGDSETLVGTAWATLTAHGTLQTGEAIDIRGGFTIDSNDLSSISETAGSGTGSLYLVIRTRGTTLKLTGQVEGSASGGFVAPEDPHTMEVAGSGTMRFEATSHTTPEEDTPSDLEEEEDPLPWDLSTWPEETAEHFRLLLDLQHPESDEET
jgi:hypothetical protein